MEFPIHVVVFMPNLYYDFIEDCCRLKSVSLHSSAECCPIKIQRVESDIFYDSANPFLHRCSINPKRTSLPSIHRIQFTLGVGP